MGLHQQAYCARHPDRVKESHKTYYEKNRDHLLVLAREEWEACKSDPVYAAWRRKQKNKAELLRRHRHHIHAVTARFPA